jgi:hypothetical protein
MFTTMLIISANNVSQLERPLKALQYKFPFCQFVVSTIPSIGAVLDVISMEIDESLLPFVDRDKMFACMRYCAHGATIQ